MRIKIRNFRRFCISVDTDIKDEIPTVLHDDGLNDHNEDLISLVTC